MRVLKLFLLIFTLCAMLSCDAKAATEQKLTGSDLSAASVSAQGLWESTPWTGVPWLSYPGGGRLTLEHGLGRVPRLIQVYISFANDGAGAGPTAGDLSRIKAVDDKIVTLENGTEQDYFVRVVLQ